MHLFNYNLNVLFLDHNKTYQIESKHKNNCLKKSVNKCSRPVSVSSASSEGRLLGVGRNNPIGLSNCRFIAIGLSVQQCNFFF